MCQKWTKQFVQRIHFTKDVANCLVKSCWKVSKSVQNRQNSIHLNKPLANCLILAVIAVKSLKYLEKLVKCLQTCRQLSKFGRACCQC